MSFPRYERYKDSGVEWLGEVPSTWSIRRMKNLFEIKKRIAGDTGYDILSITQSGIKIKDIESNEGQVAMDYAKYQFVYPGDFAMNHMDLLTGYIDISKVEGVTSPDYRVFAVRNPHLCHPGYFLRLFQSAYHQKIFYAFGEGASQFGRWRLPTEAFNDFALPYPTLAEQALISPFLDHETAKIDALIEEQRRLIELLKEKRQAVISHAVTKGLDLAAPYRSSGSAWIGELPAHWQVLQLGRVCRDVADGPHFSPPYVDEGIPFLSARNVKVDGWSLEDVKYVSQELCDVFDRRVIPEYGDVLYTKGGTTGVARAVDLDFRFQVWVHIAVLKLKRDMVIPEYLAFVLNGISCYEQAQLLTRGATNNDLGLTRMVKIWFALPPLEEQKAILEALQNTVVALDALTGDAEIAIALLQERRSALISAAVTGKIDVRNYTPKESA